MLDDYVCLNLSLDNDLWLLTLRARNQTFNALALLLFHVVQKRRHKCPASEYIEYIRHASKLVKVLLFCATEDNLAHCYLQTFEPYAVFFDLAEEPDLAEVSNELRKYSRPEDDNDRQSHISTWSGSSGTVSDCSSASGTTVPACPELNDMQLDALASHLLDIFEKPFGGEGRVERCPHLSLQPPMTVTESNHARFWNSRGFKVPAWNRDQSQTAKKLPLKRLYDGDAINGAGGNRGKFGYKMRKVDDIEAFFRRAT